MKKVVTSLKVPLLVKTELMTKKDFMSALGKDKSLLASGITGVEGHFKSGDVVKITDKDGKEFARGLSNYSSEDISKVKGMRSDKFKALLGHSGSDEIIHKDNLVIL